jgi:nicotinate-nucleotide adenylyltransferase
MKCPRRVAGLGGTFDPIHIGHLAAAYAVLKQQWAQEVMFVPVGKPPHKPAGTHATSEHRWCMSVLATLDEPRFRVARWEVDRTGPTYALDTVRLAKAELAGASKAPIELVWVIGTDAMALIHTWHEVRALFDETRFLVVARADFDEAALRIELARTVPWAPQAAVEFLEMPHIEASSTAIRANLAAGAPTPELPTSVATYIQRYRLYQGVVGYTT